MADRQNFTEAQRQSAFAMNAAWLRGRTIDGIMIAIAYESLKDGGLIYYCENCLFCHTDRGYFDVDHLIPDTQFKQWQKHEQARMPENMMILCKSKSLGDFGCNQSKGGKLYVPKVRGLAYSLRNIDMNCFPLKDRPYTWT